MISIEGIANELLKSLGSLLSSGFQSRRKSREKRQEIINLLVFLIFDLRVLIGLFEHQTRILPVRIEKWRDFIPQIINLFPPKLVVQIALAYNIAEVIGLESAGGDPTLIQELKNSLEKLIDYSKDLTGKKQGSGLKKLWRVIFLI